MVVRHTKMQTSSPTPTPLPSNKTSVSSLPPLYVKASAASPNGTRAIMKLISTSRFDVNIAIIDFAILIENLTK